MKIVLWTAFVLSLIAAGVCSIAFVDKVPGGASMQRWFFVAATVAVATFAAGWRIDHHEAATVGTVMFALGALVGGSVAWAGEQPEPRAIPFFAAFALAFAVCAGVLVRDHFVKDVLPDLLRAEFGNAVREIAGGLQIAALCSGGEVRAGEVFGVRFIAQNCFDKERTLHPRLSVGTRISLNRATLDFDEDAALVVPPGAVAFIDLPVLAESGASGKYELIADPRASGEGGTRIRRRRAMGLDRRAPTWALLLDVHGGGLSFPVRVTPSPGAQEQPLPEPATQVVWQPDADALALQVAS